MAAGVSRLKVGLAFGAIYLFWGSTFLANRFALDALPPLLLAGARHFTAGVLLYAFARLRGAPRPQARYWPTAALIGGLMLVLGNGGVVFSQEYVPSGIAAVLIAMVPLWMVGLDWIWKGSGRPAPRVLGGVALGLVGIGVLAGPGSLGGRIDPVGLEILLVSGLCWATGSLLSRDAKLPAGLIGVAMEMLCGGTILLAASAVHGGMRGLRVEAVTRASLLGLGYLIVFGSLAGFTAYNWLLAHVPAAKAATYAYVNPVIAVGLGFVVFGEPLTPRLLIASAVILCWVVLITTSPRTPELPAEKLGAPGAALQARESES